MNRLLIVGYGDIARRLTGATGPAFDVRILSRRHGRDLDRPATLERLDGADLVLHCAPPAPEGDHDHRTSNLLAALERDRILPRRLVYIGTSGVYGDCGGALVDEARPPNPQTGRARRRRDAETRLQDWCAAKGVACVLLRAPGIYAADRLPVARLRAGAPVLRDEDDVYTNHVHADDLAAIARRALDDDAPAGVYNASDDSQLRMGAWMDLVADRCALPRPPRVSREEAKGRIPPARRAFMQESRRLDNRRLKEALGYRFLFPTVFDGVPGRART